jgi:hypothetical protein
MKIYLVETDLLHAGGETDGRSQRRTDMTDLTVTFCSFQTRLKAGQTGHKDVEQIHRFYSREQRRDLVNIKMLHLFTYKTGNFNDRVS